jgi:hypothetical protein
VTRYRKASNKVFPFIRSILSCAEILVLHIV